jgi:hypothetical protein
MLVPPLRLQRQGGAFVAEEDFHEPSEVDALSPRMMESLAVYDFHGRSRPLIVERPSGPGQREGSNFPTPRRCAVSDSGSRPRQASVSGNPSEGGASSREQGTPMSLDSGAICAHTSVHVHRITDISSDTFTAEIFVDVSWLIGTTSAPVIEAVLKELNDSSAGKRRFWTPRVSVRNCQRWLRRGEPRIRFSTGGELKPSTSAPVATIVHMKLSGLALLESISPACVVLPLGSNLGLTLTEIEPRPDAHLPV